MSDDISVRHNPERNRYELLVGEELASLAEYSDRDGVRVFNHTETQAPFRGRGLAAQVVRYALEDVRGSGLSVVPSCWFVADFISANPEFEPLLAKAG